MFKNKNPLNIVHGEIGYCCAAPEIEKVSDLYPEDVLWYTLTFHYEKPFQKFKSLETLLLDPPKRRRRKKCLHVFY